MPILRCLVFLLCLLAGCSAREFRFSTEGPLVRLYYTPLHVIGWMTVHPHFLVYDVDERPQVPGWQRWEIWNDTSLHDPKLIHERGTVVYRNLFSLNANVGLGQQIWMEWSGDAARRIIDVLWLSQDIYPHRYEYWCWPGPNSNTFVTWVLNRAKIEFDPPWRAWGSSY